MEVSVFEIKKMDCPSEEKLIRMKLDGLENIKNLDFDIPKRKLLVYHSGGLDLIERSLHQLNLDASKISTQETEQVNFEEEDNQRSLLWAVLLINFCFFIIEAATGLISNSMGLVADSLDMLADSLVYGISLLVVGGTLARKKQIALLAGYFQVFLALLGFVEVMRRFSGHSELPRFSTMITVSLLALLANALCLYLLQRSKGKDEVHMKASLIFTSNDVIINLGVLIAGILVHLLSSRLPDLIIGTIVFGLVLQGAVRILKLGN